VLRIYAHDFIVFVEWHLQANWLRKAGFDIKLERIHQCGLVLLFRNLAVYKLQSHSAMWFGYEQQILCEFDPIRIDWVILNWEIIGCLGYQIVS